MGNVWKGAAILTAAALAAKLLSALYRVPYQNMVGDIGFYIYQQVYPIYGIVVALSLTGYPVAVSKLVAERLAGQDEAGAAASVRVALLVLSVLGVILFASLYLGAGVIASAMGDGRLTPLVRLLSFSFLLFPPIALLRGYFQGRHDMTPTAASQVGEQFVRVTAILGLSYGAVQRGADVYACGMAAVAGTLVGMGAALFILLFFLSRRRRLKTSGRTPPAWDRQVGRRLLTAGTVICLTNMALTLIPLVDSFLFVPLLQEAGARLDEVQRLKGVYDRGQPLIQLGTVVGTSFSLALVPLLSGARRQGAVFAYGALSIRLAVVIGLGASLGLICLIRPINAMLFENDYGSSVLAVLSSSVVFYYDRVDRLCIIARNGEGMDGRCRRGVGSGGEGRAYALACSAVWSAWRRRGDDGCLCAHGRRFYAPFLPREYRTAGRKYMYPTVKAAAMMAVVLHGYRWLMDSSSEGRLWAAAEALGGVAIGAVVYLACIVKGHVFLNRSWQLSHWLINSVYD